MNELRLRVALLLVSLLLVWFLALLATDGAYASVGISPLAALCCTVAAAAVVTLPARWMVRPRLMVALPPAAFLLIKVALGHPVVGDSLASTLAELLAIVASVLLARPIARCLAEFEASVVHLMIDHLDDPSLSLESGEPAMYREVRRARSHQRPLTMMAFSIERAQPGVALDHLLERVQRETIQKYCESQLAHLLACETRESDVIARRDGKLFALLTESDHRSAPLMASRVCAAAANRLGLELRMGISRFPDQALTLDKMIEDAESQLQGDARQPAAQRVRSKESLLGGAPEVSERRTESA